MARTFAEFVANQVSRCEALPSGRDYMYSEAAQTEICDWLEGRCNTRYDAVKSSDLMWLSDSADARKIKAVIDYIMDAGDKTPTIREIRGTWDTVHGTHKPANYDCPDCGGSGFAMVVSRTGAEGSRRCLRGCSVPAPRLEAEIPSTGVDEVANTALGEAFGRDLAAKLAKPMQPIKAPPPLVNPLTVEDIERAKKEKK